MVTVTPIRKRDGKPKGYWKIRENRTKFFLDFAAEKGFDPYVPENWRNVTYTELREKKVSKEIIIEATG